MSDYIKREDVLQAIVGLLNVTEQIDSADVVEVVRCKDCKRGGWRVSGLDNKTKGYRCAIHAVLGFDFGDNGYCSYGKRKENEIDS